MVGQCWIPRIMLPAKTKRCSTQAVGLFTPVHLHISSCCLSSSSAWLSVIRTCKRVIPNLWQVIHTWPIGGTTEGTSRIQIPKGWTAGLAQISWYFLRRGQVEWWHARSNSCDQKNMREPAYSRNSYWKLSTEITRNKLPTMGWNKAR